MYAPHGYTAREQIRRELTSSSLYDFKSVAEFGDHVKQQIQKLAEIGVTVSTTVTTIPSWVVKSHLVQELEPEFEDFVDRILNDSVKTFP